MKDVIKYQLIKCSTDLLLILTCNHLLQAKSSQHQEQKLIILWITSTFKWEHNRSCGLWNIKKCSKKKEHWLANEPLMSVLFGLTSLLTSFYLFPVMKDGDINTNLANSTNLKYNRWGNDIVWHVTLNRS